MSWKNILKVSLDAEGNSYSEPKWIDEDNFLGPTMVLAEKRETPLYVYMVYNYSDEQAGYLFDNLEEAKKYAGNDKIITVEPSDRKTLLEGVSLYKKIQEIDFTDRLEDQERNTLQLLVDDFFRGKNINPRRIYDYLDDALDVMTYGDVSMEEDPQKLKEQMQEIVEELEYLGEFFYY
jgi:hypothetical protein